MNKAIKLIFIFFAGSAMLLIAIVLVSVIAIATEAIHPSRTTEAVIAAGDSLARDVGLFPVPTQPKRAPLAIGDVMRLIGVSALKHNVPREFVRSIVAAESNFNSEAVSPKGAIGLMQLMPETAKMYGADATAPDQNIDAGTHYLRALMDRYKRYRDPLPRVIAAYNAGPAMVDKYRGVPPFRETRSYVSHVLGFLNQFGAELKNARRSAPLTQFAEASAAAQVLYLFPHRAKAFAIR